MYAKDNNSNFVLPKKWGFKSLIRKNDLIFPCKYFKPTMLIYLLRLMKNHMKFKVTFLLREKHFAAIRAHRSLDR